MKNKFLLSVMLFFLISAAQAQYVSTFAGSGVSGAVDANGINASFNQPGYMCMDPAGNLYVADYRNNKIRKITPTGDVTTFVGSGSQGATDGTGTGATFYRPASICIDSQGNFYVADFMNHKIRKVTSGGVVTTFAGSGFQGSANGNGTSASFDFPADLVADAADNIYVVDKENNKIRKITPSGDVTTFAGANFSGSTDGMGTTARFNKPSGICIDASGNFYISDQYNQKIRKITPAGQVSTIAGSGAQGSTDGAAATASFYYPTGICIDTSGNLFVADFSNEKIRKITPLGIVSTYAGSGAQGANDGNAATATFFSPTGVFVDDSDLIYVSDQFNHKIRKIEESTAGIDDNEFIKGVTVYPNPSNGFITIHFSKEVNNSFFILNDISGRQVMIGELNSQKTRLDFSSFLTGLYFIEVVTDQGKAIKKVIIK